MARTSRSRRGERGTSLIEFAFCLVLFWLPLVLGMLVIGFNLIRAVQVTQVARDAGHMYANGINFAQSTYQNLLVSLAIGLNMTATGGNGVVILSTVMYVDSAACTAGGYTTSNCPNYNTFVFTNRVVVGNSGLHSSSLGAPVSTELDSNGNVSQAGQLTDTKNQVSGFTSIIPAPSSGSEFAYVSEMFVRSTDTSWAAFLSTPTINARSIF